MVTCPKCGACIEVISFGFGYVAICCGRFIYDSLKYPDKENENWRQIESEHQISLWSK
jgi:hypothetical protein